MRIVHLLGIAGAEAHETPAARLWAKRLERHQFGHILVVAFVAIILSGVIISHLDPAIEPIWDGMWWTWVTMVTVGYGDAVPHSAAGRLFASLRIIFVRLNREISA